jgi:hypothetical protein
MFLTSQETRRPEKPTHAKPHVGNMTTGREANEPNPEPLFLQFRKLTARSVNRRDSLVSGAIACEQ